MQALVLVPEISLTPQLEARFREAFPDARLAVLHSGLRRHRAHRAPGSPPRAARPASCSARASRVLAPMPRLALVVVDEEHDASFKQQEGLRYSARDVAVYRAKLAGCPVVLGTATPSLETWHNWRAGPLRAPASCRSARRPARGCRRCARVDLRADRPEQGFAASLLAAIGERLARGEQSLVFINRRGYAPVLACEACGWTAGCERCTARMVLHAADRRPALPPLRRRERDPARLPDLRQRRPASRWAAARSASRRRWRRAFPSARIVRIDRDSARRRGELARTLEGIRRGEGDILVGTQLLAKGHDFPGLTLVGVLNADSALVSTDYRAAERLFAVLAQVAGRAGRREQPGEVLVQTRYPGHPLFAALARPRLRRLRRSAARRAPRARASRRSCFEAALRAEAPKLDSRDALSCATRPRWSRAPDEVQRLRPGAAPPHAPRRLRARAAAHAVALRARRCRTSCGAWRERLFETAPRAACAGTSTSIRSSSTRMRA